MSSNGEKEDLREVLQKIARRAVPGCEVIDIAPLGAETDGAGVTSKMAGYGMPVRLDLRRKSGEEVRLVFRTASANPFGHDWRADRAAEMLVAFDTFSAIPDHIQATDVGAIERSGRDFVSLSGAGEFYLLTTYVPGKPYAHDLRALAQAGRAGDRDAARVRTLARWLAALHQPVEGPSTLYTRALRDAIGSGEGIFGIIDGYPADVPGAPPSRLREIEARCVEWRWRLRGREDRLRRIHGDFHPFNVLFDGDDLHLLDASRGSVGDPADDVACMAVNYIFFALEGAGSWSGAFRALWNEFWRSYFEARADEELLQVVAPHLTWRLLVLCNPQWYPKLPGDSRDRLLSFAERSLAADELDLSWADDVFRGLG